jgi:3-phosphoshikimate 1-carboxyvinyltransferase
MRINPTSTLKGRVILPADKSISHRYAILAAMARGVSWINNFSSSQDCRSTLACLMQLGISLVQQGNDVRIESPGWQNLTEPTKPLDAGNSGTTIRLLSAVLAGRPMKTIIAGDESLNRRPMKRIMIPLERMGASIEAFEGQYPPLQISGNRLRAITYDLPVASAQVKSCVLLAGLTATGRTKVIEHQPTRDHTERALPAFGVPVKRQAGTVTISGPSTLQPAQVHVPADFSAAAYFILPALMLPGSRIFLPGVGLNPTRTALLSLLLDSGADIRHENITKFQNEPVADLTISYSPSVTASFPSEIPADLIPNLIDEIPVLAVFGTRLARGLTIRKAEELRKKESDRIANVVSNLASVGIRVEEWPDGFRILPGQTIRGGRIKTQGDHRIAMSFAVAGLLAEQPIEIDDPACAAVSFPNFFTKLESITG